MSTLSQTWVGQLTNWFRNFSLAKLEWNHARGITSVVVGVGLDRGEVVEEGCCVSDVVLLATEVGVPAVENEKSSAARRMLEVSRETGADDGG